MKLYQLAGALSAALMLGNPAFAQDAGKAAPTKAAAVAKALDNAMTPGEAQKRLEPMIGKFDVRILTWVDPSKPPVESNASAVSVWVLGDRYVQTMLVGGSSADAFNGIGYIGYDNIAMAGWPSHRLTTIAQPLDEMMAATVVLAREREAALYTGE